MDQHLPHNGTSASRDGARHALPRAGSQCDLIFNLLREEPFGLTDHQIADRLGFPLSVVNARRNQLMRSGLVISLGVERGPAGALRTVWALNQTGGHS